MYNTYQDIITYEMAYDKPPRYQIFKEVLHKVFYYPNQSFLKLQILTNNDIVNLFLYYIIL